MLEKEGMSRHTIDTKDGGPHLLVTAGVHGDEYEPVLAAYKLVKYIKTVLIKGKVTIVPLVNKSAYQRCSRYGSDGLDLARICPGNAEGSISEKIAAQVSTLIQSADYYVDMHTGGQVYDIFPLAGFMIHSSAAISAQQQRMAEAFNFPVVWGTDGTAPGRTLSVARDAQVPAVYLESGGGNSVRKGIIDTYFEGCLNLLRCLGMSKPHSTAISTIQYRVNDSTPGSGHLQNKNPACMAGIFIPEVKLGEYVKKNQLWGRIVNPANGREKAVRVLEDGIVLFLRTSPTVSRGDSLGGLLPSHLLNKTFCYV